MGTTPGCGGAGCPTLPLVSLVLLSCVWVSPPGCGGCPTLPLVSLVPLSCVCRDPLFVQCRDPGVVALE